MAAPPWNLDKAQRYLHDWTEKNKNQDFPPPVALEFIFSTWAPPAVAASAAGLTHAFKSVGAIYWSVFDSTKLVIST